MSTQALLLNSSVLSQQDDTTLILISLLVIGLVVFAILAVFFGGVDLTMYLQNVGERKGTRRAIEENLDTIRLIAKQNDVRGRLAREILEKWEEITNAEINGLKKDRQLKVLLEAKIGPLLDAHEKG
ncbi:MAG: hypothetical protein WBD86_03785 [Microgenomates group bacterium]